MKIRTDFVTNSSSSCYVILTIGTKDNREYYGVFDVDDAGHYGGTVYELFTLEEALKARTGKDVLDLINQKMETVAVDYAHYEDGFIKSLDDRDFTISISELEKIPAREIKTIYLSEDVGMDEGSFESEYIIDLTVKTEKVAFEEDFGGIVHVYQAEKDLKTGKKTIIVDEKHDSEPDEDEEEW